MENTLNLGMGAPQFRAWDGTAMHPVVVMKLQAPLEVRHLVQAPPANDGKAAYQLSAPWQPIALMQYIGANCKAGKPIYTGDVIEQGFENEFGSFIHGVGVVEWCPNHFAFEVAQGVGMERRGVYIMHGNCTILGNVYQNPDLIHHTYGKKA